MSDTNSRIAEIVQSNDVVLFMKGTPLFPQCGFSNTAVTILDRLGVAFEGVDVLQDMEIRQGIKAYSDWPTVPQLYVKGRRQRHHDGNVPGRRTGRTDGRGQSRAGGVTARMVSLIPGVLGGGGAAETRVRPRLYSRLLGGYEG
jgi:monothiol glutaredoxin